MFVNNINNLAVRSNDESTLAGGGSTSPFLKVATKNNRVYDGFTTNKTINSAPNGHIRAVEFSNDKKFLILGMEVSPFFKIYDVPTLNDAGTLSESPGSIVYGLGVSPDSSMVALAMALTPFCKVYRLPALTLITNVPGVSNLVGEVKFSPNQQYLCVATFTTSVRIHNVSDWSLNTTLSVGGSAAGCAWSPDGNYLAIATNGSNYIYVFDTRTWNSVTIQGGFPNGACYGVDFSSDGKYMAVAGYGVTRLTIYDATTWTKLSTGITNPTNRTRRVKFSRDSKYMAAAVDNGVPYVNIYKTIDFSLLPNAFSTINTESVYFL